ncbi:MAG: GNAT family N-acetyltransferase [Bdellovibrionales bacterium]|nr:GNAT family N-acetyltransferase [Bdellovibrionales bacterium]
MLNLIEPSPYYSKLKHRTYTSKNKLSLEIGPYHLKTADDDGERKESFKLRHTIFNQEFRGLSGSGLDQDEFDDLFDHIIIIHKPTQQLIGTYRVCSISQSDKSYVAQEFYIESLLNQKEKALELGRACIHKNYRKGSVIALLWRGIANYMNCSQTDFLFGCSSLKINSSWEAALVFQHLIEEKKVELDHFCNPTPKYQFADFSYHFNTLKIGLNNSQKIRAQSLIPPLLESYFKLGAKIIAQPAFDQDFNCVDLLTLLRKKDLSHHVVQRFKMVP